MDETPPPFLIEKTIAAPFLVEVSSAFYVQGIPAMIGGVLISTAQVVLIDPSQDRMLCPNENGRLTLANVHQVVPRGPKRRNLYL